LKGANIFLGGAFGSSVLATANILSAAVLAKGKTVIEYAACEPEITDLANCLVKMGAKITGIGSPQLTIHGVKELKPIEYKIIPDRIEAGTFICAAAITKGKLKIKNCRLDHLWAAVNKLRSMNVTIDETEDGCEVSCNSHMEATDLTTLPYPGFPTDLQAQFMACLCLARGNSVITEKIFEDRFMHVPELTRMSANLRKEGPHVIISGVEKLTGAPVMASDLRASAALVVAALAAHGETIINRVYHIDRGYEKIEEKLNAVGAKIQRLSI
jgi:UDP-N-acetylglucosamine 1-carboxyvinyltransferase